MRAIGVAENLMLPFAAALLCAATLCACTNSSERLKDVAGALNPDVAADNAQQDARLQYDKSVAEYRNCLSANPTNAGGCDGQRRIMEANERVLSAAVQRPNNTNVTVQGR
jgi:hypothetical protein